MYCINVCINPGLCRLWLTAERALTGAETLGSAPAAMSGTLIAACMLVLQRIRADVAKAHEGPVLGLQDALERLVIPLAGFCQRPGPNQAAAITLLTKTSSAALSSVDWLHALDEVRGSILVCLLNMWGGPHIGWKEWKGTVFTWVDGN
jgi:hypothetical protein